MYYEINVALNGRHFFATAKRSITTREDLDKAYAIFQKKFPKEEGYTMQATRWEHHGVAISPLSDTLQPGE